MPAKLKSSATLGLYVAAKNERDYYQVTAYPVWVGPTPGDMRRIDEGLPPPAQPISVTRVRNYSWDYGAGGPLDLDNLRVQAQGNNEDSAMKRQVYGWDIRYYPYMVDMAFALRMAKALATIDKRMDKQVEKWGRARTYGQYLLYVANAIGATKFVLENKADRNGSFDDSDYRITDPANGADQVDFWVKRWQEAGACPVSA